MKPLRPVVDAHYQKYKKSCSPSLIEIMLKRYELVSENYYALQDKYQNDNVGLEHFGGETIEGLHIEQHNTGGGQSFVERIRKEYADGKMIGLYCITPGDPAEGRHGWIVEDIQGDQIKLLSKFSELGKGEGKDTAEPTWPIAGPGAITITDVIVGTVQVPEPEEEDIGE